MKDKVENRLLGRVAAWTRKVPQAEAAMRKCINCRKRKPCVVIHMSIPEEEYGETLCICRMCLSKDKGHLGKYLASFINRKTIPRAQGGSLVYVDNPVY
jgi:hypothetical protein